jgi:hypothetical protein
MFPYLRKHGATLGRVGERRGQTMTRAEHTYRLFLDMIDTSVAGRDNYGDLRWHVECSAETNAGDTMNDTGGTWYSDAYWASALDTAKMCVDDWRSFFPQLRK